MRTFAAVSGRAVTVQYLSVDILDAIEAGSQRGNCGRCGYMSCCVPVKVRSQTRGQTMRREASDLVDAMSYACCRRIATPISKVDNP